MRLYFTVPDTLQTQNGNACAELSAPVCRFYGACPGSQISGAAAFLPTVRPCWPTAGCTPGQVLSFDLPPEAGRRGPAAGHCRAGGLRGCLCRGAGKAAPSGGAPHSELPRAGTLANGYAAWALQQGRSPVFRPVNRIDKDTSGLVLAARNTYAAPLLAENVQKLYYAIVEGELPLGPGVIDAPHRPPGRQHHRAVCDPRRASPAAPSTPY